jgi:tol-pal system protein YbgF
MRRAAEDAVAKRTSVLFLATSVLGCAVVLSGCAATAQTQSDNRELRRMVVETRQELEQVRRDQDRLRALVEYMQFADGSPQGGKPYPSVSGEPKDPRWTGDSAWSYQREGETYAASADDYDPSTAATGSAPGPASAPGMPSGFPGGAYPQTADGDQPAPGAPVGSLASRDTTGGIVAGVRGGGNWVEPGESGLDKDIPHVPVSLRGSGFDDGVRAFVDRNYDDAIQYFRDFIHRSPSSGHADDAQYWIGESYLRKGLYSNAIKEFNQVVLRYGSGDRSAASLLKLAQVFTKIGDDVDARLSLQRLVNRYPGSEEAQRANSLLVQMGG